MPYGFIKYIENKGYSHETVRSYEKILSQFFSYLKKTYFKDLEPYQINPSDIKNYLEEQKDKEKTISTINKELAILKSFFHYLWEIDKVPIDPTVKIKRQKSDNTPALSITYKQIEELIPKVLSDQTYSPLRKAIFILATKGLKTADYRFKKEHVVDSPKKDIVEIKLKNRNVVLKGQEAACFLEYFYETLLIDTEYVFTTKPHGEENRVPIQVMSILNHLRHIASDYLPSSAQPLTLLSIRRAIALEYYKRNVSIQQIALNLGIEESSASNYLKHLIEG